MAQELRSFTRMPLEAEVIFQEIAFDKEAETVQSKYKDVSGGGLLLTSSKLLPLGALLKLEIRVPGLSQHHSTSFRLPHHLAQKPLAAVGQVARIEALDSGEFDLGIKFLNVYPDDLKALLSFINSSGQAK